MNLSSGYPFDLIRNGLPYDYPRLEADGRADVVIMGGGISGALTAYRLCKAGIDCWVMDARSIGLGSTCASTSLLQYEIDTPLYQLAERIGERNAARCYALSAESIVALEEICRDIRFHSFYYRPSIYFAASTKHVAMLQKEYTARSNCGFDVHWMDEASLNRTYGLQSPAAIRSSLGAQADAYTLTHALHQHNISRGVKVYDRSPVVKIDHTKKGVKLVTGNGRLVRCKKLVYATGYESVKYIDRKIVQLYSTYATASEQFGNDHLLWEDKALFWNTGDPYLYARLTTDNRIMTGGRDERYTTGRKSDALIEKKAQQLCRDFTSRFPSIPFIKEFSWTGIFGSTKDGLPFIGAYNKLPNSLFALGFGGNGITFSVLAAGMVKDMILGKVNRDAKLFSFTRL